MPDAMGRRNTPILPENEQTALFTALAQFDDAFQQPTPVGKSMEGIATEINPALRVEELGREVARTKTSGLADRAWKITTPSGAGFVYADRKHQVWIDVSRLAPGKSLGNQVYGVAEAFAVNNGRVFIGDPAGLSRTGFFRRLENMISSTLRYGSTDHLMPHKAQLEPESYYDGHPAFKGLGLNWKVGDTSHNLAEMLRVSYEAARRNMKDLEHFVYDFDRNEFVDTRSGRGRDRESLENVLLPRDSGKATGSHPVYRGGSTTKARVVLLNTVVRQGGEAGRRSLLATLGDLLSRERLEGPPFIRSSTPSPTEPEPEA
jgi:hypothetical protein